MSETINISFFIRISCERQELHSEKHDRVMYSTNMASDADYNNAVLDRLIKHKYVISSRQQQAVAALSSNGVNRSGPSCIPSE